MKYIYLSFTETTILIRGPTQTTDYRVESWSRLTEFICGHVLVYDDDMFLLLDVRGLLVGALGQPDLYL